MSTSNEEQRAKWNAYRREYNRRKREENPERERARKLVYNRRQYEKRKARLALISGTQHTFGS